MDVSGRCLDVVLVDNDLDASQALTDLLQDEGYSVMWTPNGHKALDYLRRYSRPRMIILDVMPGMDGREFLEHQSREPALLDIPI